MNNQIRADVDGRNCLGKTENLINKDRKHYKVEINMKRRSKLMLWSC